MYMSAESNGFVVVDCSHGLYSRLSVGAFNADSTAVLRRQLHGGTLLWDVVCVQ